MKILIDGDLASNNGGWQWSASTGVDPAPYFRIFNPYTQSQKVRFTSDIFFVDSGIHRLVVYDQADPTGEYIRYFVPELSKLRGEGLSNHDCKLSMKSDQPLQTYTIHHLR